MSGPGQRGHPVGWGGTPGRATAGHSWASLCRRAKLLLKKKRYQEQLLDRTENQISSLEAMVGGRVLRPGVQVQLEAALPGCMDIGISPKSGKLLLSDAWG